MTTMFKSAVKLKEVAKRYADVVAVDYVDLADNVLDIPSADTGGVVTSNNE